MRATDRSKQDLYRLGRVVLLVMLSMVASLVVLNGLMLTKTEAAQRRGRNWDGYPKLGGSFELRQTALNAGYNEGSKEGRRDRGKERSKTTATSSHIRTPIRITVQNSEAGTYIKDISAWLSRAVTRRRILHRPEIETVIQTMAITIGVENTGDVIGVNMTRTVAPANCAKLR